MSKIQSVSQSKFFSRHSVIAEIPHLRAYARLMTNDSVVADDAVRLSLEKIIAFQDDLYPSKLPMIWPLKMLRDVLLNDETISTLEWPDKLEAVGDWANVPRHELCQALAALSFENREAVVLMSSLHYKLADIAEICDCDRTELKRRFHEGIFKLSVFLCTPEPTVIH